MKRVLGFILVVCMLAGAAVPTVFAAGEKTSVSRSIAIVFDNSGSMYLGNGMAWSRATYAIEVFASMMNEGDSLRVYPMHEIKTSGGVFNEDQPLSFKSPKEASVIRGIFTEKPDSTPIETVEKAAEWLSGAGGERWLVVVTDGDTFYRGKGAAEKTIGRDEVTRVLREKNESMNVLYLGINTGKTPVKPELAPGAFAGRVDIASKSEEVLSKLTAMCNMIFGRDELRVSGRNISFDVSLSKLFVFIQGENIAGVSLKDSSGKAVKPAANALNPTHPDGNGNGIYPNAKADTSLQGTIVTYGELPAGDYSLDYTGNASSVGVYYEPDVDMQVQLINPEGKAVKSQDDLIPGDYRIEYSLRDGKTGEETNSQLLGKTEFELEYALGGKKETKKSDRAGAEKITLNADDVLKFDHIQAKYLSGYSIRKTGKDFGFPWDLEGGIQVKKHEAGKLELRLSGGQSVYHLSEMQEETPFKAELFYEGEKVTGEALKLNDEGWRYDVIGSNIVPQKKVQDDHVDIYLTYPDGDASKVQCGRMTLVVQAIYEPENTEPSHAEAEVSFTVENDVTGLRADIEAPKMGGYTAKELKNSELRVKLRMGGQHLTQAEMDDLRGEVTLRSKDGEIAVVTEADYENSELVIKTAQDKIKTGKYTLSVKAQTKDRIGEISEATDEASFKVTSIPFWLLLLLILLGLILLALLIWFILSRKVLPKKAYISETSFYVRGNVQGDAYLNYYNRFRLFDFLFNKQTATMSVESPQGPSGAENVTCSAMFELRARDTLFKYLKSKAGSLSADAYPQRSVSTDVKSINLAGTEIEYKDGSAVTDDGVTDPSQPVIFRSGSEIEIRYVGIAGRGRVNGDLRVVVDFKK